MLVSHWREAHSMGWDIRACLVWWSFCSFFGEEQELRGQGLVSNKQFTTEDSFYEYRFTGVI